MEDATGYGMTWAVTWITSTGYVSTVSALLCSLTSHFMQLERLVTQLIQATKLKRIAM